jgi:hypothetical protein
MKSLQVWLEDADFERLQRAKGNATWRRFFLSLIEQKAGVGNVSPTPGPDPPTDQKEASVT